MKKKILISLGAIAAVVASVAAFSAFEAHVINVTAHIENALSLNTYGIDFGTVFPQEYVEKPFIVSLSDSFKAETEVASVSYKLVQKDKPWILNFDGDVPDVNAHNRTLVFVDPDQGKGERYTISGGKLTITTGNDVEDLFGPNEMAGDWTAPRMVIPMGGNFIIETQVTADPLGYPGSLNPYQSGGILVYESNGNVVRLELTRFSGLGANAVYMESQESGVKVGKAWDAVAENDTVYLRLSRNGDVFKGEYSIDGTTWNAVTVQEGDFINEQIGDNPKVGLAVTDNNEDNGNNSFSASFEYISFNKGYLSLCSFLSKTKDVSESDENDVGEESYFNPESGGSCRAINANIPQAGGTLTRGADDLDKWWVDLKVPPIVGYVGQDWPVSCAPWVVAENETDYGCDIWVEVTGVVR